MQVPPNVNEGQTVTWTLTRPSQSVQYIHNGISCVDIGNASLTGNFVVGSGMTRQITPFNDAITEGQETAVLSLNNGGASSSLIINDTSVYPDIKNTDISGHCKI